MRRIPSMFACCVMTGVVSSLPASQTADLAVINARIITVDPEIPAAQALAVRGNKIVAVGSSADVQALITDSTRILDARGRTVAPGFNDAHIHPRPIYPVLSRLGTVPCDPEHVSSIEQLIAELRKKAAVTPRGEWIIGTRYQDTKLGRHPTRYDLDKASRRHPIYVGHSSGHVAAVNSLALELAKVDRDTPDPRGGAFDRDQNAAPTGVCRETAKSIVLEAGPERPQATTQEKLDGYQRCFQEYLSQGITSIQIAGTDPDTLTTLQLLRARGQPIRIYAMLRNEYLEDLKRIDRAHGLGDDHLRLGAMKHWFGNSLSGQTCWLYQPYAGRPNYFGIPPKDSQADINGHVLAIHEAGFQACIHANGDREIDMLLDAFESALQKRPRDNHRHRIEHCSVVNEEILKRIKKLEIVLAPHSYVYEHGDKMEAYGSQRWGMMHPNRSAVDMGIAVAGNSDAPVSKPSPMLRIQSMVTRQSAEGKVYGAEQKVTVEQAIHAWTMGSAFASFEEHIKGSLTVGKLADFVVLSRDPRGVPADEIRFIQVDTTVIDGKVEFERAVDGPVRTVPLPDKEPTKLRPLARLGAGPAAENSGIVKSRHHPNVFWMHNDSADEPRIYPIRVNGEVYQSERYPDTPGVLIGGAINVDWEDISIDNQGHVIIADFGNNRNDRRDLVLYYVDEPSPLAGRTTLKRKVFFRYPDQHIFPAPSENFNFDSEAIYTLGEKVYVLTKHRSDAYTKLYRLDNTEPFQTNVLTFVDRFDIRGKVVGADASPDGRRVVVITYKAIWLFDLAEDNDNIFAGLIRWMPFQAPQVEAVCFADDANLLLADEEEGVLYKVAIDELVRVGAGLTK